MDLYETLNDCRYSQFDLIKKAGSETRQRGDTCGKDTLNATAREVDSTKPLKYFTTNFFDNEVKLSRGINFSDGIGIPMCRVDIDSKQRYAPITNLNFPQSLPALPLPTTANYSKGQGPVDIEDSIRNQYQRERKDCIDKDTQYYKRSFGIFDGLEVVPNGCVDNYVQKSVGFRQGASTRDINNTAYKKRY
jgi:hypothetical protein